MKQWYCPHCEFTADPVIYTPELTIDRKLNNPVYSPDTFWQCPKCGVQGLILQFKPSGKTEKLTFIEALEKIGLAYSPHLVNTTIFWGSEIDFTYNPHSSIDYIEEYEVQDPTLKSKVQKGDFWEYINYPRNAIGSHREVEITLRSLITYFYEVYYQDPLEILPSPIEEKFDKIITHYKDFEIYLGYNTNQFSDYQPVAGLILTNREQYNFISEEEKKLAIKHNKVWNFSITKKTKLPDKKVGNFLSVGGFEDERIIAKDAYDLEKLIEFIYATFNQVRK